MLTTSHIADVLGRKAIAAAVQVGETAVSNAVVRGKFPSAWYIAVTAMAAERGLECPPSLFGMKTPNRTNAANPGASADPQRAPVAPDPGGSGRARRGPPRSSTF